MSSLIHCIYTSAATRAFEARELAELLSVARRNNERLDVTGMLLHADGSFFQILEGARETVEALYQRIETDPRHSRVTRIIREPIARRAFSAWTMGFADLSAEEAADLAGANDFFGRGECFARLDACRAKKMLAAFDGGRWRSKPPPAREARA